VKATVYHRHGLSVAGGMLPEMQSVHSICPIASAKRANPCSLNRQWTGIRTCATYRFLTDKPYPFASEGFGIRERSRRNHNLSGQMAAPMSAATVSPCPIRAASSPRPQPRPRTPHVCNPARTRTVREQATATSADYPQSVRSRVESCA